MNSTYEYDTMNQDYTVKQQNDDAFESTIKEERKRQKNIFAGNDIDYSKNMRYQQEQIKPSQDTMKVQKTLNDYGYTDQQGKKLKVDGAYGPKTDYAFNNAYNANKSVFENREKQRKRNEIVPFLSSAYDPLVQKANSRKLNMPKDEVVKTKQFLNQFGYTDMQDKPLVENDVWDDNAKMAFEKYVWDGIARQEVLDLQKSLNKNGITDKDGNTLLEDGKLGRKTDGAVHNALRTLDDKSDTKIKRGDGSEYIINPDEIINNSVFNQPRNIGDMQIDPNNLFASTTAVPLSNHSNDIEKVIQESKDKNIEIKAKPNLTKFDIPYQYKVTDEEVLSEQDLIRINALKGLYAWAIENGDRLLADKAHKAAVKIRSSFQYNGKGYGENYIDNYEYSAEFDPDKKMNSLVEMPLDDVTIIPIHSNFVDDFIDAGALDLVLPWLGARLGISPDVIEGIINSTNITSFLSGGFDYQNLSVQVGDVPIYLDNDTYYYRPSNGTIIKG